MKLREELFPFQGEELKSTISNEIKFQIHIMQKIIPAPIVNMRLIET
jgi:hypothetical protein